MSDVLGGLYWKLNMDTRRPSERQEDWRSNPLESKVMVKEIGKDCISEGWEGNLKVDW